VKIDAAAQAADGLWVVHVHQGRASDLLCAVDPALPFVIIEGHSPAGPGWQHLTVPISPDVGAAEPRTVRTVRFDLLVSAAEAVHLGQHLDAAGEGGLFLWQTAQRPPDYLSISQKEGRARADAIRGARALLVIDLPHARETALMLSPDHEALDSAVDRLGAIPPSI
jgi:hypothetical protein